MDTNNKNSIIELMKEFSDLAEEIKCDVKLNIKFDGKCFSLNNVFIDIEEELENFELVRYNKLDKYLRSISKKFNIKIDSAIFFDYNLLSDIKKVYGRSKAIIYTPSFNKEDKNTLKKYKESYDKLHFSPIIYGNKKSEIKGFDIDKLRIVYNIEDIVNFINNIIENVDKTEDISKIEFRKPITSNDVLESIKSNLKIVKNTDYFDDFKQNGLFIDKSNISIYYEAIKGEPYSYISIYDRGYFLSDCSYGDKSKLSNMTLPLEYTFEDLSALTATNDFLKSFKLRNRVDLVNNKEIIKYNKEKNTIDYRDFFEGYLNKNILESLRGYPEFEIVINKGLATKIIEKNLQNSTYILGINDNNEKIFIVNFQKDKIRNLKIVRNNIIKDVNSIIKDINYNEL